MLTEKNRYYLATMGIDVWLPKSSRKVVVEKPINHCVFLLRSILDDAVVGELWLEVFEHEFAEDEVLKLLDAMLKAINVVCKKTEVPAPVSAAPMPVVIVMGEALAQYVLRSKKTLDELREANLHQLDAGKQLLVTYHPVQLLRQPGDKRKAWTDLKKI